MPCLAVAGGAAPFLACAIAGRSTCRHRFLKSSCSLQTPRSSDPPTPHASLCLRCLAVAMEESATRAAPAAGEAGQGNPLRSGGGQESPWIFPVGDWCFWPQDGRRINMTAAARRGCRLRWDIFTLRRGMLIRERAPGALLALDLQHQLSFLFWKFFSTTFLFWRVLTCKYSFCA